MIAGLAGQNSGQFREVTLTAEDIAQLKTLDPNALYEGDGELLKLALQAYSLGIAHEFNPYFGLSISRMDPLPQQLEAVYEYFMKLPSVIEDEDALKREIAALEAERNQAAATINWRFSTTDARHKLRRTYPSVSH